MEQGTDIGTERTGIVTRADLEARLARLREESADPVAGVFGPGSVTWRVDREAVVFLAAGRALLLQLAHPWVAAAIARHSTSLEDPIGRFHRTFRIVFTLVFGSLDQACAAARRLHARHAAVTGSMPDSVGPYAAGSPYRANEASALLWVHATLVESAALAHDLVLPRLSPEDCQRYHAESRRLAALFGIPDEAVPGDWAAFKAYCARMQGSDALTVGQEARRVAARFLEQPILGLRPPRWYRAVTAGLLPERLRRPFGLEADERLATRAIGRARALYPRLPARLRFVPAWLEAEARLKGRAPGPLTRGLNRLWIGTPRLGGEAPDRRSGRP